MRRLHRWNCVVHLFAHEWARSPISSAINSLQPCNMPPCLQVTKFFGALADFDLLNMCCSQRLFIIPEKTYPDHRFRSQSFSSWTAFRGASRVSNFFEERANIADAFYRYSKPVNEQIAPLFSIIGRCAPFLNAIYFACDHVVLAKQASIFCNIAPIAHTRCFKRCFAC